MLNGAAAPGIDHSIIQGSRSGGIWDASLGNDNGGNLDADPLLGALANNGGSTPTMQPGAGSAAIDTGTCINAPPADQRGLSRPQGAACDIGAVELRDLIFRDGFNPPGP